MCSLYTLFRFLARRWFLFAVVLIMATFAFGIIGLVRLHPENSPLTDLYVVVLLFTLNYSEVAKNVGWELEVARWLGFVVWGFTLGSILLKLFGRRAMVLF